MAKFSQVNCYEAISWSGTNTQIGLQRTYYEFAGAEPTVTVGGKTVTRKPVFIFLTDGEPTFGSFNYMDPSSDYGDSDRSGGPRYGIGTDGRCGMLGYYTILSANYFKDMVSAHYGRQTSFYSIGIGIYSSGNGNAYYDRTKVNTYPADDAYRRAVINPTASTIKDLATEPTYTYSDSSFNAAMQVAYWSASRMLYNLLTSSNPAQYVQNIMVRNYTRNDSGSWTTVNTDEYWLRGITNPYSGTDEDGRLNYSYADDAIFYGEFTEKNLEKFFDEIIGTVQKVNYGILLESGTDLVITDPLGEGMEVKGSPTLIYNGVVYKIDPLTDLKHYYSDYGFCTEYTWKVTTPTRAGADKKGTQTGDITARIHYDEDTGLEVVQFIIPENLLPALYPDTYQEFYYEELPVRLVYKVGLTDEAAQAAEAGDVFYTNLYEEGDDPTTYTTFYPDSTNPYYVLNDPEDENYVKEPWLANDNNEREKEDNTTGTADDAFLEEVNYVEDEDKNWEDWDEIVVKQLLGNNGKIIMSTTSATNPLTVTKQWASGTDPEEISVTLYGSGTKQAADSTTTTEGTWAIQTVKLNSANSWSYTWTDLPESETKDGYTYTYEDYYISEVAGDGYQATYKDSSGNALSAEEITVTSATQTSTTETVNAAQVDGNKITIINTPTYNLPNSGGVGTQIYTLSGMAICTTVISLYALIRRRQRNRGRGGEAS
jgi:hypothetical protein